MPGRRRAGGRKRKRRSAAVDDPALSAEEWQKIARRAIELLQQQVPDAKVSTVLVFEKGSNPTIVVANGAEMTKYENEFRGPVGSVAQGEKAQAINLGNVSQAPAPEAAAYLSALGPELQKLLEAMRTEKSEPEHEVEIGMVSAADAAIKKGDTSQAFDFLKRTGKWAFDVATKIGVSVAAEALKHATGA